MTFKPAVRPLVWKNSLIPGASVPKTYFILLPSFEVRVGGCVETSICVVFRARAHQFQLAVGPET